MAKKTTTAETAVAKVASVIARPATPAPIPFTAEQAALVKPAPAQVVVSNPDREFLASVRRSRVVQVARAAESIVDALDTVAAVSRAIRMGVDDAVTVGRMDATLQVRAACEAATEAKANPAKVAALKWAALARLASAKRK